MKLNGAELIIRMLQRQGVSIVAGIPGGANLPLYDALSQSDSRHVLARHEQGAGFIAQGMARATGRPAVCFGTSGPGATNLLTAIADAKLDSIPLVAITAQVPRKMIGTDAFQEIDTYGLTIPITKHNFLVRSAASCSKFFPTRSGSRLRAARGRSSSTSRRTCRPRRSRSTRCPMPARARSRRRRSLARICRRAAELINSAQRPMLLIGAGIIAAEASEDLLRLMDKASIPAAATLLGLGAIPNDHPLFLGMVGMHAARYTNLLLEECDLLIGLGVRFDDRATGKAAEFCPRAKILHVDIDPSELGKIKKPSLGIAADVGELLRALAPLIAAESARASGSDTSRCCVRAIRWRCRARRTRCARTGSFATPAALLPRDAIVTTDVGQHQMWVAQAYPFSQPRQLLTSGGLGTMGFGLPAAIGAALAKPERDGRLLQRRRQPADEPPGARDRGRGERQRQGHPAQQRAPRPRSPAAAALLRRAFSRFAVSREPDFAAIARGFDVARSISAASRIRSRRSREALATPGPCLINVPIAAEENVYPMVPPGGANRDMIGGEADERA